MSMVDIDRRDVELIFEEESAMWLRDILSFTWKNWGDFQMFIRSKGLTPPPEEVIDLLSEAVPED